VRKEPQAEKEKQTTIDVNIDTHVNPKLIKEWEQFDSIISGLECSKDTDTSKVADTQGITSPQVLSRTSGSPISKDVEIIPKDPSEQIILQVEDIPPLDVFYSPRHRAVVKRQRKRRRTDQPSIFPEQTVTGNVVWKEEFDPSDDLTKLSQYAGAYSAATIDKASKVSLLLKNKDQEISALQAELAETKQKAEQTEEQLLAQQQMNSQLTQQLQAEKQRIDQSVIQKQKELSEALAQLRATNEQMMKTKDEQIAQLSSQLEKVKGTSQVVEFRAEASLINSALISQVKLLCQQITQAEPLCELTTSINQQVEKARNELDQAEEVITTFIYWQDSEQGREANLPRISETHKDILFTEWHSQMMKAERAASRCKATSSNLVELVNNTLYLSNMISQCTPGKMTTTNTLEQACYPDLEEKGRLIAGINRAS